MIPRFSLVYQQPTPESTQLLFSSSLLRRSNIASRIGFLILLCISSACTTRQVTDAVSGSTAQRLVTYSLEAFVDELFSQPQFEPIAFSKIDLNVHFLKDHVMLDYATAVLGFQLQSKHQIELTETGEASDYEVDVFFNSLGTDYDTFGLSIPSLGLTANETVSVLTADMFHGVTEGYALVKRVGGTAVERTEKILTRVRTDNITTPVIDFPLNQLDLDWQRK